MINKNLILPVAKKSIKKVRRSIKRAISLYKLELEYLEFNLTDHCNLNCKGCSHFSPIANKNYASVNQHERDLRKLGQLFRNIQTIRLLGGEPLLHPDVASFMVKTREAFPRSTIRLVTNGLLLPRASQEFYKTCKETKTIIDLIVYPPLRNRLTNNLYLLKTKGVDFKIIEVENFSAFLNLKGNSSKKKALDSCRSKFGYCPFLHNGHIYHCAVSALVENFNKRFNYNISLDKGINIHSTKLSGHSIIKKLNVPIETCRWCSEENILFPWEISNRTIDDWDAQIQNKTQNN